MVSVNHPAAVSIAARCASRSSAIRPNRYQAPVIANLYNQGYNHDYGQESHQSYDNQGYYNNNN